MADIDIKRKRSGLWPLILGLTLVALAVLAWATLWRDTAVTYDMPPVTGTTATDTTAVPPTGAEARSRLDAYQTFVESTPLTPGRSHEYTATGIRRFAAALREITETHRLGDTALPGELDTLEQKAARLEADPDSTRHAELVKDAFASAADAAARVQKASDADAAELRKNIDELQGLARDVDASAPLLGQEQLVRDFFRESEEVLQQLAKG